MSRPVASTTASTSTPRSSVGSPLLLQQGGDLGAQIVLPGQAQRGQEPEADGLPVAVAGVAGDRLDRVGHGVAEVEDLAAAAVALVLRHDRQLGPGAREDDRRRRPRRRTGPAPTAAPPAISAVLTTSAKPAARSASGSVSSTLGSTSTAAGWW